MASKLANLKRITNPEEAREQGRRGGIASGEARRKRRDLRLALATLMDGVNTSGKTGTERMAAALFRKALDGDVKAIAMVQELVKQATSIEMPLTLEEALA